MIYTLIWLLFVGTSTMCIVPLRYIYPCVDVSNAPDLYTLLGWGLADYHNKSSQMMRTIGGKVGIFHSQKVAPRNVAFLPWNSNFLRSRVVIYVLGRVARKRWANIAAPPVEWDSLSYSLQAINLCQIVTWWPKRWIAINTYWTQWQDSFGCFLEWW